MNAPQKILNAITAALDGDPAPAPEPKYQDVRVQLERHRPEGSLYFVTSRARYGIPSQMQAELGRKALPLVTDADVRIAHIREWHTNAKRVFGELNAYAAKTASQLQAAHVNELAEQIAAGSDQPGYVEQLDGYNRREFESDREVKIQAFKKILADIMLQIHAEVKPILAAAISVTSETIETELAREGDRFATWGIPYTEPSEILRSLRQAREYFESRLHGQPTGYTSTSSLTCGLIPLA